MNTWEDNYSIPIDKIADDMRNNITIPLLRMVQKLGGIEIKRNKILLDIGGIINGIEMELYK